MQVEECHREFGTTVGAWTRRLASTHFSHSQYIFLCMSQALPTNEGIMMAARCSVEDVTQAIKKLGVQAQVSIASVNGPNSIVVAGAEAEVLMVMSELGQEGKRLSVSHAFHSPLMMPMAEEFRAVVRVLSESGTTPSLPVVSTVTGSMASAEELADPEHWVRQVWS